MGMRRAAFARNRIDCLDAIRAFFIEIVIGQGDDLALAHTGLQRLGDLVIAAVDHRRRGVEQHQLVLALELAGVEHHLLAVAHVEADALQLEQHRGLDQIDADGHIGDAFLHQDRLDLLRRLAEQADIGMDGAPQAQSPARQ